MNFSGWDLVEEVKTKGTLEEIHELNAELRAEVSTSITQITRIEVNLLRDGALTIDCWENDSVSAIELSAEHGRDLYKTLGQWYD